jgi:ABC-type nitrate/sulfonate/bicarbonate transport system substrate-binding protein
MPRRRDVRWVRGAGLPLLLVGATLIAACSSSSSSAPAKTSSTGTSGSPTTISVSATLFSGDMIPFTYATATDLWKKYHLKVNLTIQSSAVQFTSLGSGQTDLAIGGDTGIAAAQQGAPVKIVGSLGPNWTEFLAQSSVKDTSSLRGATIGASAPGSVFDVAQRLYLQQSGLSAGSYKTTYFQGNFPACVTALIQGKIAGAMTQGTFTFTALSGNPKLHSLVTLSSDPHLAILTATYLSANTAWAAQHRAAVTNFIRAWQDAAAQVRAHQQAAVADFAAASKASASEVSQIYQHQLSYDQIKGISPADFNLFKQGLAGAFPQISKATYAQSIDNSYLP